MGCGKVLRNGGIGIQWCIEMNLFTHSATSSAAQPLFRNSPGTGYDTGDDAVDRESGRAGICGSKCNLIQMSNADVNVNVAFLSATS